MSETFEEKFIDLFNQYHKDIYRFLRIKVASNEIAEDLASEAFMRAWGYIARNPSKYPDNPRAYLYKTARNCLVDYYRTAKSKELILDDSILQTIDNNVKNDKVYIDSFGVDFVEINRLKQALNSISAGDAELVTLRYLDDLSYREIGEIIGKSEGTVRTALHRAFRNLRNYMVADTNTEA